MLATLKSEDLNTFGLSPGQQIQLGAWIRLSKLSITKLKGSNPLFEDSMSGRYHRGNHREPGSRHQTQPGGPGLPGEHGEGLFGGTELRLMKAHGGIYFLDKAEKKKEEVTERGDRSVTITAMDA